MKSAQEILKAREEKKQQRLKEHTELINTEMLEIEKILNKYENNLEDTKPYITVQMIIKTDEVKQLLKEKGYYIDKTSNDIEYNTTRIYLNEEDYNKATGKITLKQINRDTNNSSIVSNIDEILKIIGQKYYNNQGRYC